MMASLLLPLLGTTTTPVLTWAASRGAFVGSMLRVDETSEVRGLVTTEDVRKGTVLLTIPSALQLGVEACGGDDMRGLLDTIPGQLWNARLGLALWAEKQRGGASPFEPYVSSLPAALSSCLAPGYSAVDSAALSAWPPTATRTAAMRRALIELQSSLARVAGGQLGEAPSVEQLGWAVSIASSRAYRVRGAPGADGADAARLLPVVDLANYAPAADANCALANAPSEGGAEASSDPLAVSVYAARDIGAGCELLIDYGNGATLSNEQLLLEYGFVLPGLRGDTVELPFGAVAVGLRAIGEEGEEEEEVGEGAGEGREEEEEEGVLASRQATLLAQLGDVEAAGLVFGHDGLPDERTLALALVLASRAAEDLDHATPTELVSCCRGERAASPHARRARRLLLAVAAEALHEVDRALAARSQTAPPGDADGFEEVARAFCGTRRALLELACDRLSDAPA